MKPQQSLVQLMSGALIAVAALTACRKEVPLPKPAPEEVPKPKGDASVDVAFLGMAGMARMAPQQSH